MAKRTKPGIANAQRRPQPSCSSPGSMRSVARTATQMNEASAALTATLKTTLIAPHSPIAADCQAE